MDAREAAWEGRGVRRAEDRRGNVGDNKRGSVRRQGGR